MARIDHEIQRVVAEVLAGLRDPRLGFVTVTRAEITQDLKHCKVFVSIIGDRHVARQSMEVLERSKGFVRGELGHAIDLRHVPELIFVEDRSTERAIELAKAIDRANATPVIDE